MSDLNPIDIMSSGIILAVDVAGDADMSAASGTILAGTLLALNASTGNLTPFVKGGTELVNGVPVTLLSYQAVSTGVPLAVRVLRRGSVKASQLVIDADGDGSNLDEVVKMQIRDAGIDPLPV